MYCLLMNRQAGRITIEVVGESSPDEVHALARDLELRAHEVSGQAHDILLDLSSLAPNQPAVTAALETVTAAGLASAGCRMTVVVADQLVARQLDQLAETRGQGDRLRHFAQTADAARWLAKD